MRIPGVYRATLKRLKAPLYWATISAVSALWLLVAWTLWPGALPLQVVLSPLAWSLITLLVFPLPWQWTGDDRPLAPFLRGLAQAIVCNGACALILIGLLALSHSGSNPHHPHPPEAGFRPQGIPGALPFNPRAVIGSLSYAALGLLMGWLLANKERAEAAEHEAVLAATEARRHLLQSQMSPHVLFNAMSGLSELVYENPKAAEQAILNLAGLMRDLLDYSTCHLKPLAQERVMVERYLALEQIRLGKRLRTSWEWDRSLEHLEVPPLLLQPLVENAIKHGISPQRSGGDIKIRLAIGPKGPELEVADSGIGLVDPRLEGVGIRNLRERLALFNPQASFHLIREDGWTRALLLLGSLP